MRCLILGGAACVWDDACRALEICDYDLTIAVNDIGAEWPEPIDWWVSLHPEKLFPIWRPARAAAGFNENYKIACHEGHTWEGRRVAEIDLVTGSQWPGMGTSGSSGLFAVKVALEIGATRIVLAGVPMQAEGAHFFDKGPWDAVSGFLPAWQGALPYIKDKTRSMSGYTRQILGEPSPAWLAS